MHSSDKHTPLFEYLSEVGESIRRLHEYLQSAEVQQARLNYLERIAQAQVALQQTIEANMRGWEQNAANISRFADNLKNLPDNLRSALMTLGNHGWFPDMHMSPRETFKYAEALQSSDINISEAAIAAHFRDRTQAIEESICRSYPDRGGIIAAAFRAHNAGEYNLSVPVFLAQADGML